MLDNPFIYKTLCFIFIILILWCINEINDYKPLMFTPSVIVMWAISFCIFKFNLWKQLKLVFMFIFNFTVDKDWENAFFIFLFFIVLAIHIQLFFEYFIYTVSVFKNLEYHLYQIFIYKKKAHIRYFIIVMTLWLPITILYTFNVGSVIFAWYIIIYFYSRGGRVIKYSIPRKDKKIFITYFILLLFIFFIIFWCNIFYSYMFLFDQVLDLPKIYCKLN